MTGVDARLRLAETGGGPSGGFITGGMGPPGSAGRELPIVCGGGPAGGFMTGGLTVTLCGGGPAGGVMTGGTAGDFTGIDLVWGGAIFHP